VCLASLIGGAPAIAQTGSRIKLTLPYAVTIGRVMLPAGDCTITDLKDNGYQTLFVVRSEAGPAADLMMERTGAPDDPQASASSVQLRHIGNSYTLDGIRINGNGYKVN
jgi:hypothetical protein